MLWPLIAASLLVSAAGIIRRRPSWLIAGTVIGLPFALYLGMTPRFRFLGFLLPLFQVGAALAVRRSRHAAAWLLLLPLAGVSAFLGLFVLLQDVLPYPSPPRLRVLAGDKEIPSVLGSYCWRNSFQGICADTGSPQEILASRRIAPAVVPAGSTLRISFEIPPDKVQVSRWAKGSTQSVVLAPDGTFAVPREPGVYLYDVFARWSRGDASHAFHVEVRDADAAGRPLGTAQPGSMR